MLKKTILRKFAEAHGPVLKKGDKAKKLSETNIHINVKFPDGYYDRIPG